MINSVNLNSYWEFITDEKEEGSKNNWHDHIPEGTEKIRVPCCWNEHREELYHYDGVAWYYKNLLIKERKNIKRLVLFFYGVNYICEVFINGSSAGSHVGGYTPFEIDITKHVKYNTENLIAVRVDAKTDVFTVPPVNVDWFNYGGIYRDVMLLGTGDSWIDDIAVRTKMEGSIGVEVNVGNFSNSEDYILVMNVFDPEKQVEIAALTKELKTMRSVFSFEIQNVKLWSQEHPFMYEFKATLIKNGNVVDKWEHNIGVREFSIKDRKVFINGKAVRLRGYSKHEEYPMLGRTFSGDIVRKDYEICKKGNANFVRLCHYPHHLKEYEIASEMGLLAIAEVPNVNLKKAHLADKSIRDNCVSQLKEMIKYYKNETCIAFWSLFVECDTYENEAVDFVPMCINIVKELDPTRMTVHASNIPEEDRTYDYFDVVGINYWSGWYHGETIEQGSKMLDRVASKYPDKPVLITSGGFEGIYGHHSPRKNEKWSEEMQAEYLVNVSRMYLSKDYIIGEIIWTFNDFRVSPWFKSNEGGQDFASWVLRPMEMNNKGVVDLFRRTKLSYHAVAEIFKKWDEV